MNLYRRFSAFMTVAAMMISIPAVPADAEVPDLIQDSGIDYTEFVGTIQNPGAGYTTTVWANCRPGNTPVYSPSGSLVLFFIDIGAFSSGANGTTDDEGSYTPGQDYDLDDAFFESWQTTFENCRRNGCTVALRFRYDANGKADPEPATFEQILRHIEQIRQSGLLEEYKDMICFVESGFVGKWGEQHGGKYTSAAYKAQLLDALLDAVPESVPVTVRTPDTFAVWAGHSRSDLDDPAVFEAAMSSADPDERRILSKRVGMYNDGYMGSDSDLGTFADREAETNWLSRVAEETYYGGEFSGNIDFAMQYDTYLPENAIPEMYKTHLSYVNGNIFQLYKDYTFSADCDVKGVDNSAYYGQNAFQFIRDHLGYRFVIRKSELTSQTVQGGEVQLHFSIENTGFAALHHAASAQVFIEQYGCYYSAPVDIDARTWASCSTSEETLTLSLPDSIRTGHYNIFLSLDLCEGANVRFANDHVWNPQLKANYLGSFSVSESSEHGTDNEFRQKDGSMPGSYEMRTYCGNVTVDGEMRYQTEWSDDDRLGDSGIFVKADAKNLYVFGGLNSGAQAPVYNIQLEDPESGESYWLYFASNGFVYFNHGDYAGCECKWNDGIVEFCLPFDKFGLRPGAVINGLRIFQQDSADDWKLMGDISIPEVTVPKDLRVYSAPYDIRLAEGSSITLRAVTEELSGASYEWYCDDRKLDCTGAEYTINNADADSAGCYTVRVTAESGAAKLIEVADVLEVIGSIYLPGDANVDGEVNMADAVAVMRSQADPDSYALSSKGRRNADVYGNGDGVTNNDALAIQRFEAGIIDKLPC